MNNIIITHQVTKWNYNMLMNQSRNTSLIYVM